MKRLTISVEGDQYAEIEEKADERGVSKSQVVRERLRYGEDAVKNGEGIVNLREDLDELEQRVGELEAQNTPTAQNGSDSLSVDSSPERMHTPHQPAPVDGFGWVALGEYRERVAVDDELREDMETALENIEVPGRKSRVGYTRREAVKFAWDLLREAGEAQSSWLANSTFGEFFEEPDLKYSTSSRYPGYGMWDGCVRDVLKQLPGVVDPGERGQYWRFET